MEIEAFSCCYNPQAPILHRHSYENIFRKFADGKSFVYEICEIVLSFSGKLIFI
jgi:hypothetical protein